MKNKSPISNLEMGLLVATLGIEPKSRASETLILSVVRRGRHGTTKVAIKAVAAKRG
jgi:hypothetical protein